MGHLELAYVPGVMPGKWVKRFQETHEHETLTARLLSEGEDPLTALTAGRTRLVLLRFPEGESPAGPRLHVIPLYTERPVVVAPRDHDVEYFDEDAVVDADTAAEWPRLDPADYPEEVGGTAMMLEVLAAGDRAVAVLPQSLARMHSRKDTVYRFVDGVRPTVVGLAWLRVDPALSDADQPLALQAQDDPLVEEMIGVVRGRRAGSSRQPSVREREQATKQAKQEKQKARRQAKKQAQQQDRKRQSEEGNHGRGNGRRAAGSRRGSAGAGNRRRGGPRRG